MNGTKNGHSPLAADDRHHSVGDGVVVSFPPTHFPRLFRLPLLHPCASIDTVSFQPNIPTDAFL